MKRHIIILNLLFLAGICQAQQLSGIPASFVDIGFGARPAGLGGAYTAMANDVNSTFWNPAGMASASSSQASFTYTNQLGMLAYNSFSAIMPLGMAGAGQAAGIAVISSGDKALREFTVQGSYARAFGGKLRAGVTAKFRHASFGNNALNASDYVVFEPDEINDGLANQVMGSANGFGVDLGVQYDLTPTIKFGVMAKDLLAPMSWTSSTASAAQNAAGSARGSYSESLPAEVAIGTALMMIDNVAFTSDFHPALTKTSNSTLHSGVEVRLLNLIALRAGIQQNFNNDERSKYSAGMGINYGMSTSTTVLLDYTFMSESIANTQRLSLGVEF
jgi:hypothetical protein